MPDAHPNIAAAAVCEHVLDEKDNVLSLIRLVDVVTNRFVAEPGAPEPAIEVQAYFVLVLKAGDVRGPHIIHIRLLEPDRLKVMGADTKVNFETPEAGVNVILPLAFATTKAGLWWFEVLFDDEETPLTRIPLRIAQERVGSESSSSA